MTDLLKALRFEAGDIYNGTPLEHVDGFEAAIIERANKLLESKLEALKPVRVWGRQRSCKPRMFEDGSGYLEMRDFKMSSDTLEAWLLGAKEMGEEK